MLGDPRKKYRERNKLEVYAAVKEALRMVGIELKVTMVIKDESSRNTA
jgi:hypothetical protein